MAETKTKTRTLWPATQPMPDQPVPTRGVNPARPPSGFPATDGEDRQRNLLLKRRQR